MTRSGVFFGVIAYFKKLLKMIDNVLGDSKAQKLSRSSLISSGRLKTGMINEKSLAIIDTKLHKEIELK
jgi:hypothetical protein